MDPTTNLPKTIEGVPLRYAFFDPGGTTGWALFDESGTLRFWGQAAGTRALTQLLKELPESIDFVLCEDYIARPGVNHRRVPAVHAIGMIEMYADLRGIRKDRQQPSDRKMGYKRLGMTPPSDHSKSHKFDAIAHGEFWVFKHRIRKEWAHRAQANRTQESGV